MPQLDDRLRTFWPALLMLAVLALLPIGATAGYLVVVIAIIGLSLFITERDRVVPNDGLRVACVLFACYWIAAALSGIVAVAPAKTWSTIGGLLRFLPFVVFACLTLRDGRIWPRIIAGCAAIVTLWLLDAWVQIFTGYSLAGAMSAERLSGIFGADNLKLGPVLAVLSPFVFIAARDRFGARGLVVAFVFQLIPILLAGSRAAWLMFALVVVVFAWREAKSVVRFVAFGVVAAGIVAAAAGIAWYASTAFDARVQRSLLVLNGSQRDVDEAAAGRLRIWGTATRMIEAHPITGVGVRGFRFAYATYAEPGDAFVDNANDDQGASHAHQIVLEILSETGIVGLALWITGVAAAIRAWRRASSMARQRAFAPAVALVAMCFPINTHLAFYSAWWGLLFWWLVALYCAALGARDDV